MAPSGLYARLCHAFLVIYSCRVRIRKKRPWKKTSTKVGKLVHNIRFAFKFFASNNTSISANADGLRDAASRKIEHNALPAEYNNQATSVG